LLLLPWGRVNVDDVLPRLLGSGLLGGSGRNLLGGSGCLCHHLVFVPIVVIIKVVEVFVIVLVVIAVIVVVACVICN
jgi:hypothetical protein